MSSEEIGHRLVTSLSSALGKDIEARRSGGRIVLDVPGGASPSDREVLDEASRLLTEQESDRVTISRLQRQLGEAKRRNADLIEQNRTLREMVIHDLLTGLYTRWFVHDKIEEEIQRSERYDQPTTVLMLDLDHFKRINDSYGHLVGDEVLRELGQVIRDSLRTYDVPGRYGGEEFCLMLPSTDTEKTILVAERLRTNIARHQFTMAGKRFNVTASIGIAGRSRSSDVQSADQLIALADRALYAAKESGRNRIELWRAAN